MKSNETFKVAVYGTLLAGERNEGYADGAISRVPCTIRGTLYDTGWNYPAFVPGEDGQEVKAEVLTVDAKVLKSMDGLEGYPRFYRRDEVEATPKMFVEPGSQWPRLSMEAHARRSITLCSTLFVHSQSTCIGVSPFQYSRKVAASSVSPLTFGTGVPLMLHANGGAMFV